MRINHPYYRNLPEGGGINISEDTIKRITLPFLKSYYKFRPELMVNDLEMGTYVRSEFDIKTKEGIIVDGYISYQKNDGSNFIATFEASSKDKQEEVFYKMQNSLLFWDGLAIGSVLTAIGFVVLYVFQQLVFNEVTFYIYPGILILSILFCAGCYTWLLHTVFKGVDRYHYIYAVEQFKRYQADEQWIAFGEDVFSGPQDAYLLELKDQCMKHGFGLIEITNDFKPIIISTPSRIDLTVGKNQVAIPLKSERITSNGKGNKRLQRAQKLSDQLGVLRFQRQYYAQVGVLFLSLFVTTAIAWIEFEKSKIVVLDRDTYLADLQDKQFDIPTSAETVVKDSADQTYIQPYTKVEEDYLNSPDDRPIFILKQRPKRTQNPTPEVPEPILIDNIPQPDEVGLYRFDSTQYLKYPCAVALPERQLRYIIQIRTFKTVEPALKNARVLNQFNIPANVLWLGCLNTGRDSFSLFLDSIFVMQQPAMERAANITTQLEAIGDSVQLVVRPLFVVTE